MRGHLMIARTLTAVAAIGCAALGPSPALASSGDFAKHAPKHKFGRGTSTNWSGYAVGGSTATHVIGMWTQPSVVDQCLSGANSWSSPWVGIDGDTSNTVEQIGTDSDCQGGSPVYYAWYEMYPKSLVTIPSITVIPGHSYQGEVTYAGGVFTLTLTDLRTGASFSTNQSSRKASRSSVEWIMEGPSSGLLTDFGTASFSGSAATIGGKSGQLDPSVFPAADPITMVTSRGVPRAVPSSPPSAGSFSVAWKHT